MKKLLYILIFLLAVQVQGWCSTLYLRSTGGNWSDPNTWSASSNGAVDGNTPTSNDTIICDPNSGSAILTINVAAQNCYPNFTGFAGTLAGSQVLNTAGNIIIASGMTYSLTGTLVINSGNLTTNGKIITGQVSFNSGIMGILDNLTIASGKDCNFSTTASTTFSTNNNNISCANFRATSTGTRTFNLGSSTITCTAFDMTGSNITFNYDTSTVIVNQNSSGAMSFSPGTAQFYNLTLNGHASTGCYKAFSVDLTVNNALTITGNSSTNKLALKSSDTTVRTITAPSVTLTNIDYYQNIKGAGDGWVGKVPFFNSSNSWNPTMKYSGILR